MISRLYAVRSWRHRWPTVELRHTKNREAPVIFRPQCESDDIKVREVEHAPKLEVDRRVGIVDSDSVVKQCVRADEARGWHSGALFEEIHSVFRKVYKGNVGKKERPVLHSVQAHHLPLRLFVEPPHVDQKSVV